MSLRDELPPAAKSGPRCTVALFVATSDRPDEWNELLDDPLVQGTQLMQVMKRYGWTHGYSPLIRHRRRVCACA